MPLFTESFPNSLVESLFDSMGDVVYCVKDLQGRYQSVNVAFVERVNVKDKVAMLGKTACDFFPPELVELYGNQDQIVFTEGRSIRDHLERITHRDGSMGWFLASKFPLRSDDNKIFGLVGISQDLHTPSDSDLELTNLKTVVDYIRQHLDQSLRVDQLANMVSMSQTQLDRRMKRVFRLSTKKYLMKCRLEEASRRLVSTTAPLAEIALACGFSDQSAFTRQFRNAANMPPLTYRKKNTNSQKSV